MGGNLGSPKAAAEILGRRVWRAAVIASIAIVAALYVFRCGSNPAGFHIDESSIAYNAWSVAQTGCDEYGNSYPLYFRAFGDYKNPTYVYLLAALFRLSGPSILVARMLSATAGLLAALALGFLAVRLTGKREVGLLTALSALLTPWIFETSRIVLELALYPLVLALFLICLQRASRHERWRRSDVAGLALTLALLTYTYSIGRLLGPLFAAGLVMFCTRVTWRSVVRTWLAYAVTLIPLVIYSDTHPGALTGRFKAVAYLEPSAGVAQMALAFAKHYFGNWNLWRLLVIGDPNRDQVAHIAGSEHLLLATFAVAALGLWVIARERLHDRWWRFVVYALVVAAIPASLTTDYSHMLRLIPVPVMLLVVAVPGFERLLILKRGWLVAATALIIAQGAAFQWRFHISAPSAWRLHLYDAEYRTRIFDRATALRSRPIYIADLPVIPGYIQAYWYAVLSGFARNELTRLAPDEPPPPGALVITTEDECFGCEVVDRVPPYMLYIAHGLAPRTRAPLPDDAFRAELQVLSSPASLHASESAIVRVRVKNLSSSTWLARERSAGTFQVSLGNHWLDHEGNTAVNDDGRAALMNDLKPAEEIELALKITAPARPGEYILEVDMLQEGVSWFGQKGSPTAKVRMAIH